MKTGYILNDWDLIVATLHYNGVAPIVATSGNTWEQAWASGDGYGKMTRDDLKRLGLMGDWSHVRDSSPEAVHSMAMVLWRALGQDGLLRVTLAVAAAGGPVKP